jgi:hypothetical protein
MRKQLLTIIATGITALAMAGGVVTNANQSASYVRMPAQDATLAPMRHTTIPLGWHLLPTVFMFQSTTSTLHKQGRLPVPFQE